VSAGLEWGARRRIGCRWFASRGASQRRRHHVAEAISGRRYWHTSFIRPGMVSRKDCRVEMVTAGQGTNRLLLYNAMNLCQNFRLKGGHVTYDI
jgi:hypothetical protein